MDNDPLTTADPDTWGVRPLLLAVGALACALLLGWTVITPAPEDRIVGGVGALVLGLATAAGWTMRRRLSAGPAGLVVRGPSGTRTVAWSQVVVVLTPTRSRYGIASTTLEIDLDDDGLLVFGRVELGADPAAVALEVRRLRAAQEEQGT